MNAMSFPESLRLDFDTLDGSPQGRILPCYRVRERKPFGREFMLRLLPDSFCSDNGLVDAFHDFFTRFAQISNKTYLAQVHSVVGAVNGPVYVLEEFVSGIPLTEFIEKNQSSVDFRRDAINIISRVCEALHYAHQKDIFHLSISPDDILIDANNPGKVKLVGFGTQILASTGRLDYLSNEGRAYMAPEVLKQGVFGPKADVYSLAVTIKELFPEFSEASDLLDKATSVTLKDRFVSARQFAANIKELSPIDPVPEPKPKVLKPTKPAKPRGGLKLVLKITTEPEGAEVLSKGETLGTVTASGLMLPWKPGNVIEIKKPGYSTETLNFQAPPENTEIFVKLTSAVTLYTNPWGAAVKINGELIGTTTYKGLTVPWDKGEIVIEKDGYNPAHFSYRAPPSDEDVSLELKALTTNSPFLDRRRLQLMGYCLAGLVVVLLAILIFGRSQNQDYDKRVSELQTQLKAKDTDISRLTLENNNQQRLKNSLEKQLADRDKEIAKLTQSDQEKYRLVEELQKQLSEWRAQSNNKDAEITRLTQEKLEEQRLRKNFEKQLSDANSELIKKGDEINRLNIAQAQPKQMSRTKQTKESLNNALWGACGANDLQRVRELLASGADPNDRNSFEGTHLMYAAANNMAELVNILLASGADISAKDRDGWTAEEYARRRNHSQIAELLRKHK